MTFAIETKNDSIMYSSSDFEHLFIRYKAESVPLGESLQSFCLRNKIPYNLFEKWYKDSRHKLVPVQVEGHPPSVVENVSEVPPSPAVEASCTALSPVRILVEIRMSNGLRVSQGNLSYPSLKRLIETLEVLC